MENREGQPVPNVTFRSRDDEGWVENSTDDIFKGKRVVLFALPGAFTPTCSATHLPRYEKLAPVFFKEGIDDIICLSVNDGFIMQAWADDQEVKSVRMLPDGNADFTRGMGMLVDKAVLGFGERSWRYSMLVNDGIIEKMFIEPEQPGDPFGESDADTMLNYVNPEAKEPETIALISRKGCPHCKRAKERLQKEGLSFNEIEVGRDIDQTSLKGLTGAMTVPQVFIGGRLVGGADDLEAHFEAA